MAVVAPPPCEPPSPLTPAPLAADLTGGSGELPVVGGLSTSRPSVLGRLQREPRPVQGHRTRPAASSQPVGELVPPLGPASTLSCGFSGCDVCRCLLIPRCSLVEVEGWVFCSHLDVTCIGARTDCSSAALQAGGGVLASQGGSDGSKELTEVSEMWCVQGAQGRT